ncbi:hypothetical protein JTB14_031692 [Gonioctena quinquepunctata]|nr:hypothetical protein JTB14_031692 [Gonioctena quinquepunctata]
MLGTRIKGGCRIKVHKDHLDKKEDTVQPCKLHYDPSYAKELLLLATSHDDQKQWVTRLIRKIQKRGFNANNSNAIDSAKISPRWTNLLVRKPRVCVKYAETRRQENIMESQAVMAVEDSSKGAYAEI